MATRIVNKTNGVTHALRVEGRTLCGVRTRNIDHEFVEDAPLSCGKCKQLHATRGTKQPLWKKSQRQELIEHIVHLKQVYLDSMILPDNRVINGFNDAIAMATNLPNVKGGE